MSDMALTSTTQQRPSFNDRVRAEIRAVMGRKQISNKDLSQRIGEDQVWVGRRLTQKSRTVPIDLVDLERIAAALDEPITSLLPRLDSNQQPAGYSAGDATVIELPLRARPTCHSRQIAA